MTPARTNRDAHALRDAQLRLSLLCVVLLFVPLMNSTGTSTLATILATDFLASPLIEALAIATAVALAAISTYPIRLLIRGRRQLQRIDEVGTDLGTAIVIRGPTKGHNIALLSFTPGRSRYPEIRNLFFIYYFILFLPITISDLFAPAAMRLTTKVSNPAALDPVGAWSTVVTLAAAFTAVHYTPRAARRLHARFNDLSICNICGHPTSPTANTILCPECGYEVKPHNTNTQP